MNESPLASNRPLVVPGVRLVLIGTGAASSAGATEANELMLPFASRTPFAFVASATLKVPTAVLAALGPSVIARVAWLPATVTPLSVPAEGTLVNVHGAVPAV